MRSYRCGKKKKKKKKGYLIWADASDVLDKSVDEFWMCQKKKKIAIVAHEPKRRRNVSGLTLTLQVSVYLSLPASVLAQALWSVSHAHTYTHKRTPNIRPSVTMETLIKTVSMRLRHRDLSNLAQRFPSRPSERTAVCSYTPARTELS